MGGDGIGEGPVRTWRALCCSALVCLAAAPKSVRAATTLIDDANVYAMPPLPPMGASAGSKITDPTFGTTIMRLTDGSDGYADCFAQYSYWPTFNKDSTWAQGVCHANNGTGRNITKFIRIDPVHFTVGTHFTQTTAPNGLYMSSSDMIWSGVDPNLILGHTREKLWAFNVASKTYTLIKDFTGAIAAGDYPIYQMSRSVDDNVFAGTILRNNAAIGYMVWRRSDDKILLQQYVSGVNEVRIDKTGRYLIVITDPYPGTIVWDLTSSVPTATNLPSDSAFSHHDAGRGTVFTSSPWNPADIRRGLSLRPLANPTTGTWIMPGKFSTCTKGCYHFSSLADNEGWGVASFCANLVPAGCSSDNSAGTSNPTAFDNEILQVALDGSGHVRRIAHHRSVGTDYRSSPMANISRDGKFIGFTSNWGNVTGKRDLFAVMIPPAPGSAPLSTDLNGDGVTNVSDVQLCVIQALGLAPCASADLDRNGLCNVADVQIVVNGVLGLR